MSHEYPAGVVRIKEANRRTLESGCVLRGLRRQLEDGRMPLGKDVSQ